MSLKVRLEAELLRCHAECEAAAAELKQIMARADPQRIVELEPAIGAVLKRIKEASGRLYDVTHALKKVVQTRGQ